MLITPLKMIGIIGGGQLGQMLTLAAKSMGYYVTILDPTPNCCAAQVADHHIVAAYDDSKALSQLADRADVITYEFENIPAQAIIELQKQAYVPQGGKPLQLTQHRLAEKSALQAMGIRVAPFQAVTQPDELQAALNELGYPAVLKTCFGGYDGKGQVVLRSEADYEQALRLLPGDCVLEAFIGFEYEASIIATRSTTGELSTFPIGLNEHRQQMLAKTTVPAPCSTIVMQKMQQLATTIMTTQDLVGTMAIECFVVGDEVYVNELAPRPHNSGHYTIEGCFVSQFEQHIRAICGWPLADTSLRQPTVMLNIYGQDIQALEKLLATLPTNTYVHWYQKGEPKQNRKMGHLTFIETPQASAQKSAEIVYNRLGYCD
ncbi:MAG: 5-(carboxyamino)imidazole ribonucleotide synthase [Culicoidibacterales bacterium]